MAGFDLETMRLLFAKCNDCIWAAQEVFGTVDKAVSWFRSEPIQEFDGLTPMQVFQQGRPQAVLDYLTSISAGPAG